MRRAQHDASNVIAARFFRPDGQVFQAGGGQRSSALMVRVYVSVCSVRAIAHFSVAAQSQ